MWIFYHNMAQSAYQGPTDVTAFIVTGAIIALCVLAPSYLENKRNESRRPS